MRHPGLMDDAGFKNCLLIGASGGIGQALAGVLPGRVTLISRSKDGLDITDEASVRRVAETLSGPFDLIFDATGGLQIDGNGPEKALAEIDPKAMAAQFAVNAIGPALLLKHFAPLMPRQGRAVFASLSARVGSIGDNHLGGWYSYRASKATQNQILRTASIELKRRRVSGLLCMTDPVHASPKGSMNDYLKGNSG
ncbi:SDR family NAD(P)-dependent oxidoreductase [Halovulum sp. GXIMD14793]